MNGDRINLACAALALGLALQAHSESERPASSLFDGATLAGWQTQGDADWRVEGGELLAGPGDGDGMLVTEGTFGNYLLTLEFTVEEGVNSGVFIHCRTSGDISPFNCYEINIWDNHPQPDHRTGSIVAHVYPPLVHVDTLGKWNRYEIRAQGDRITVVLNGETTAILSGAEQQSGYIALQKAHPGEVRFRNIRLETH